MKNIKKLLSVVLVLVMVLTSAPIGGFIDFEWGITASAIEASGKLGDNLTYTYDKTTGEVVVSGTGPMTDFHKDSPMEDKAIKSVVIEDGVTSIGSYAFPNCRELVSLTVADSVTAIGEFAFYSCDSLANVELSQNLIDIGENAFFSCFSLTNLTIPDSVVSVGASAFSGCKSLKSITIPDSVNYIGEYAFEACTSLTHITIPKNITTINIGVFYDCSNLKSVTIPSSVDNIYKYAFYECYNLTDVYYDGTDDDWNSIYIEPENDCLLDAKYPAQGSDSDFLTSGYCGDPDEGDERDIYWELDRKGVLTITGTGKMAREAFNYDLRIKEVIISDGITNIPEYCFNQCENIRKVTMGNDVETIEYSAFRECYKLKSIIFSESLITIGNEAFDNCHRLESVTLPDSLEIIEAYAFGWCHDLSDVKFSGSLKTIEYGAFIDCENLTSVYLPDSVISIESDAFRSCDGLKKVSIGSSLESISQNAFDWCWRLTEITVSKSNKYYMSENGIVYDKEKTVLYIVPRGIEGAITMPATVKGFESDAIRTCRMLTDIHVEKGNPYHKSVDGIVYTADGKRLVACPEGKVGSVIIANGTETIGRYAFYDCYSLTSVAFPSSLKFIEEYALHYCYGLTRVELPDSVETIGYHAFSECYELNYIKLPSSLKTIENYTFASCHNLSEIKLPASLERIEYGAFINCNRITNIDLPDSIISIESDAFSGCGSLEKVIIGTSLENLAQSAFSNCDSLYEITVSENNKYYASQDSVVYNKDKTNLYIVPAGISGEITIPASVEEFSYEAVRSCNKLTAIHVEDGNMNYKSVDGVVYTADGTELIACPRAKEGTVVVADGTEIIRDYAFYDCNRIKSIVLPSSIKTIGYEALSNCDNLRSINLPESVKNIGWYGLAWNRNLETINIPKSITRLNSHMLYGGGFTELILPSTVQSFDHTNWSRLKNFTILNRYCEYTSTQAPELNSECTIRAYCGSLGHTFATKRLLDFESIGHTYLDWYISKPATFEENGIERRDCAYCKGYDERVIPKLENEIFTATFLADGKVVATVEFSKGTTSLENEPKVPVKDRYIGQWEDYTLANADIIINAVYTLIKSDDASEIESSSEVIHYGDKDDVFFRLKAWADALVVKSTVSEAVPLDIVLVVDQSGSMDETLGGKTKKVEALENAAMAFVETVFENSKITGADHRISLVGFGLSGNWQGYEKNENTELLTSDRGVVKFDDITTSDYASSLMSVNVNGSVNSNISRAVYEIDARGATAADLGFEMAKGVFANTDSTGRQRVVIFMTDGEPTYSSGFDTSVANSAIYNASLLKKVYDASIYSVGVFTEADSKNTNINKFMNAVSSGYPDAVSMKNMGKGVDGQYYVTVNNTDSLTSVFKTISTESLSHTAPFDNITFIKTLSEYVTMTTQQEEQLRIDLIRKYGITNDDIIIKRNDDGTTTIQINGLTPYETVDEKGNVIYEVVVEFFASLNEKATNKGEYVIVDTEDSGVMLGKDAKAYESLFDTSGVYIDYGKTRIIFTINGEVYDIIEWDWEDIIITPEIEIGGDWYFSGWDTDVDHEDIYNGLTFDATLKKADRQITWHTADGDIIQYYIAGEVINIPAVGMTEKDEAFLSWDKSIPTTMPDENLEFYAIYGLHVHKYTSEEVVKVTCETDGVMRYTCNCDDAYEKVVEALEHNYEAMTPSLEKEDGKCAFCCTKCGNKYEYALNFEVIDTAGNKERVVYEFSLTDDDLSTNIQPEGEIKIRIPLSEIHGSVAKAIVNRKNEDGTTTQVPAVVENGFLVITCEHFTPYEINFVLPCETHKEVYWDVTKEPTCKESGVNSAICTECENVVETEEIEKLLHVESDWLIEAYPTCCKDGLQYKACSSCGEILKEEVIEKLYPDNTEWRIYKEATCYSKGLEQEFCTVCQTKLSENELPKLEHVKADWINVQKEATCIEEGIHHIVCVYCEEVLETEIVPKTEHNISGWFVYIYPTCDEDGLNARVCKYCEEVFESEPIAALGHQPSDWIVYEATCEKEGYKYIECKKCGDTLNEEYLAITDHKESEWIVEITPSCDKEGKKIKKCVYCSKELDSAVIETSGHNATDWIIDVEPTCNQIGAKHKECTICKKNIEVDTIDKLPHSESKWIIDKNATCDTDGLQHKECTVCKTVIAEEIIKKNEHNYDKNGVCIICGYKRDHICEIDGHIFDSRWIMDVEPTCTSEGSKSHHCIYCDTKKDVTVIGKLVHTYMTAKIEPTCIKEGYIIYVCNCGDTYYETLKTNVHNFNGSKCADCGFDKADSCPCNCHKSGIMAIIWKIINFFNKFLKRNTVCACGKAHY